MTSENTKFKVDYAKSGQAICRGCESKNIADNKIEKGTLRIGIVMQADRFDNHYELWHHPNCLFEIKIPTSLGEIEGIQRIRYADQLLIMQKIKATETDEEIPSKRVRTDEVDSCNLASLIKSQNESYYRIYDSMNARNSMVKEREKKQLLKDILELNSQAQPYHKSSTQVFLEHVVDVITFGAMEPCSKCSAPGYIFDGTFGYICNRRLYEFGEVKCNHREKAPRRFECIIPDNIKTFYPILNESRRPMTRVLRNIEMPHEDLSPVLSSSVITSSSVVPSSSKVASSKQILKYGTVVDPLSGLENEAHVYSTNLEFAAILTKVNIQDNKNTFYKIQLLESDNQQKYWVFYHFGRIGTTGTSNVKQFDSLQTAIDVFEKIYLDKTGNTFGLDWFHAPFKFTKVDINYSDDIDLDKLMKTNDIPSKLPERVQQLIQLCFDTRIMKDMMIELELDVEKMPLGKLSQHQIDQALEILEKISNAYHSRGSEMAFIGFSNRFYTLIPHDYGVERPPVIKDPEQINEKLQMLTNLADIQLAWNLLTTEGDVTKSPIDTCYEKLKANIESLDRSSELYKFLENYLNNTHAPTHNFKLNVEDIFEVTRDREASRYEKFKNTSNRYLLWHGSRIINFVGILSKGLKIAPPQAERTGDMFGNGIYFSDMATKSAQYCCVDRNNRYGLLLLCEVAMGDMQKYVRGFSPLHPTSNESVKGCGKTYPNPDENVVRDGVIVPCGKPLTDLTIQSDLRYNEYIVYDESKVNIKYLFKRLSHDNYTNLIKNKIRFIYRLYRLYSATIRAIDEIPGAKAYPLIGTTYQIIGVNRKDIFQVFNGIYTKYPYIVRSWIGSRAEVNIRKAEYIEKVINSSKHMEKPLKYEYIKPWFGEGLLTSIGDKWHKHRKIITPTFHFSILESFCEIFSEKSKILVELLSHHADSDVPLNIHKYVTRAALDIIIESAMGIQIDYQRKPKNEYIGAVYEISELIIHRFLRPYLALDIIYRYTASGKKFRKCLDIVHKMTTEVILNRKALRMENKLKEITPEKRPAFLDLLLDANEEQNLLSDKDIREEVDTFMFAGHDTTAAGISWTLYILGLYPNVQQQVFEELQLIFNGSDRPAVLEDLNEMKYLERVIKETMRIYPSVPSIGRILSEDVQLDQYTLPKGTMVSLGIYYLHRDPRFFPDPEKFDPDRFLPENTLSRHPYAYLPFSAGPRNCVGQKFAMYEEKSVLSSIIRNYKISSIEKRDEITLIAELILRTHNGINVKLERRRV